MAAVAASHEQNAGAIVVMSTSGTTAALVAKYRPACPILTSASAILLLSLTAQSRGRSRRLARSTCTAAATRFTTRSRDRKATTSGRPTSTSGSSTASPRRRASASCASTRLSSPCRDGAPDVRIAAQNALTVAASSSNTCAAHATSLADLAQHAYLARQRASALRSPRLTPADNPARRARQLAQVIGHCCSPCLSVQLDVWRAIASVSHGAKSDWSTSFRSGTIDRAGSDRASSTYYPHAWTRSSAAPEASRPPSWPSREPDNARSKFVPQLAHCVAWPQDRRRASPPPNRLEAKVDASARLRAALARRVPLSDCH